MNEDIAWIILHRLTWRNVDAMPGSIVITANCGHRAWIAPSSVLFQADDLGRGAYTVCTSCMPLDLLADKDTKLTAVPGSNEEFARMFHRDPSEVTAIMRAMGIGQVDD